MLDIIYKIDLVFITKNTKKEFLEEIQKEGIELNWELDTKNGQDQN